MPHGTHDFFIRGKGLKDWVMREWNTTLLAVRAPFVDSTLTSLVASTTSALMSLEALGAIQDVSQC
jgi:hypothetical protein